MTLIESKVLESVTTRDLDLGVIQPLDTLRKAALESNREPAFR